MHSVAPEPSWVGEGVENAAGRREKEWKRKEIGKTGRRWTARSTSAPTNYLIILNSTTVVNLYDDDDKN